MKKILSVLLLLALSIFIDAKNLKIITTGDMHGWIEAQPSMRMKLGGAAEIWNNWKTVEKYDKDNTLVLSAGDNFTGGAISGISEGDAVIDMMNMMQYDATAIGNHEFDYGVGKIDIWKKKANFQFLSANIYLKDNLTTPWQTPYKIYDKSGVKVGVIGLTTTDLYFLTNNAASFTTLKYQDILRDLVPKIRKEGADVIIVLAHVEQDKLVELAKSCGDLKIPLYIGGHSHEFAQRMTGTSWVVNSGEWWKGYTVVDLSIDGNVSVVTSSKQVYLWGNTIGDTETADKIDVWKNKTDKLLNIPLGYTTSGLTPEPAIYNMVTDVWLSAVPTADIAICNNGAIRQSIRPGIINYGTILGVMPFANKIVSIDIRGDKLIKSLPVNGKIGMSGIKYNGIKYVLTNGNDILNDKIYKVLMTDYQADVTPIYKESPRKELFDSWRDPIIQWLKENKSSAENPIELKIDSKQR